MDAILLSSRNGGGVVKEQKNKSKSSSNVVSEAVLKHVLNMGGKIENFADLAARNTVFYYRFIPHPCLQSFYHVHASDCKV